MIGSWQMLLGCCLVILYYFTVNNFWKKKNQFGSNLEFCEIWSRPYTNFWDIFYIQIKDISCQITINFCYLNIQYGCKIVKFYATFNYYHHHLDESIFMIIIISMEIKLKVNNCLYQPDLVWQHCSWVKKRNELPFWITFSHGNYNKRRQEERIQKKFEDDKEEIWIGGECEKGY